MANVKKVNVDLIIINLYSDRWGGGGYSKKKDLKEMQKKRYFEDLYYEFLNYFEEVCEVQEVQDSDHQMSDTE